MNGSGEHLEIHGNGAVTEECIAERRLWVAVLMIAVEDWRSGTLRARREAQRFIFEDNKNFYDVCACAGMDPSSLRSKLLKIGRRIAMEGPLMAPMAA